MSKELEALLAEEKEAPTKASPEKSEEEIKSEREKAEEARLANIQKAIAEANAELKTLRTAKKAAKSGTDEEDEEVAKIDFNDPGAKAWDKHLSSKVQPLSEEMAKEKEEVRNFALKEFLADKPALARDPEKLKRVMGTYERIRTASERTREGVITDLRKAYAAESADEILAADRNSGLERAQGDVLFSDIAVSRGSSSSRDEKEQNPHLDQADAAILAKWGMTPAEWIKQKKAQEKKS